MIRVIRPRYLGDRKIHRPRPISARFVDVLPLAGFERITDHARVSKVFAACAQIADLLAEPADLCHSDVIWSADSFLF